jgi:hypothetical protein
MQSHHRDWLVSALLGSAHWPPDTSGDVDGTIDQLLSAAQAEGVAVAVFYALGNHPCWTDLPNALQTGLGRATKQAVAWDIVSRSGLTEALDALSADGIDVLLLKGAALAHLLYPSPQCRPRGDADLLVADRETAERAWRILHGLGYRRSLGIQGHYISHQFTCTKAGHAGSGLALDIHWRLSNSSFFAQKLDFAELRACRRPVPALGPQAAALSAHHALIHALFHRAWHLGEGDPDRLIWLYDIHLMCVSFGTEDWSSFVEEVERRALQPICRDALEDLCDIFGTRIPPDVAARLSGGPQRGLLNQLNLKQPGLRRRLTDLFALPTWSQRLGFIRETLFPDVVYMRQRYGINAAWKIPYAYVRRFLSSFTRA